MKPMLIMSKLDETNANNVQVGPQLPAISNFDQKALPIRREYQNFNQSQSRTYLDRVHKETDSSNQDSHVVVFFFYTVGLTLDQDNFLKALIQRKLLRTCTVYTTSDMSKLDANFGGGKQFVELASNSRNFY